VQDLFLYSHAEDDHIAGTNGTSAQNYINKQHLQSSRPCVISGFSTPEDATDRLSRNFGKKLPLLAA